MSVNDCIDVTGNLIIDPTKAFNMQTITDAIRNAFPSDLSLIVTGIEIPKLNIKIKDVGLINPTEEIKEAAARIYNLTLKSIVKPIYDLIYELMNILSVGSLSKLKLPVFDLTIDDLFEDNIFDILMDKVLILYNNSKEQLNQILDLLKIPHNMFTEIGSPEREVYYIVKMILSSLWDSVLKEIKRVVDLILLALRAWDAIHWFVPHPTIPFSFSALWNAAINTALEEVSSFFLTAPSIQDIIDAIKQYAESIYNRAADNYLELMAVIDGFTLPVFGKPFDWQLPLNPNVNAPNFDFVKITADIKLWLTNFLSAFLQRFIALVESILNFFGLSLDIPKIEISFTLCAIRST